MPAQYIIVIPVNALWYYLNTKRIKKPAGLTDNATKFRTKREAFEKLKRIKKNYPKSYIKQIK